MRSNKTHHVLIIRVQIDTRLLARLPLLGDGGVDVGLVDDLGDELGAVVDEIGAGGGDLGAVDGVGRAVLEQQGDQSAEGIDEEADDQQVDDEEDDGTTPHGG